MCEVLAVPRSTFYHSFHKEESNRDRENKELTDRIKDIHKESHTQSIWSAQDSSSVTRRRS